MSPQGSSTYSSRSVANSPHPKQPLPRRPSTSEEQLMGGYSPDPLPSNLQSSALRPHVWETNYEGSPKHIARTPPTVISNAGSSHLTPMIVHQNSPSPSRKQAHGLPRPAGHTSTPQSPHHHPYPYQFISTYYEPNFSREPSLPSLMSYPGTRSHSPTPDPHTLTVSQHRRRQSSNLSTMNASAAAAAAAFGELASPRASSRGLRDRYSMISTSSSSAGGVIANVSNGISRASNSPSPAPASLVGGITHRRRPSTATLYAFLEGVEHHTRVRGLGEDDGRGISRSASPAPSVPRERSASPVMSRGRSFMETSYRLPSRMGSYDDNSLSRERDRLSVTSALYASPATQNRELPEMKEEPELEFEADETLKGPPELSTTFGSEDMEEAKRLDYSPDESFLDSVRDGRPPSPPPEDVAPFLPGDRLAVGRYMDGSMVVDFKEFEDSQKAQREKAEAEGEGKEIEVVRVLGTGTYAVVYLVREVLYDPPADDDGLTFDDEAYRGETVYGREYALKCLCKKDLSPDLLLVQRSEVTLHKSLPDHPNIITLIRAYENASWLFILMEYIPGQDLYFWLEERAQAEEASKNSFDDPFLQNSPQFTPPSPSLLAGSELLGRARLRLISRMFCQMCSAVAACHKLGISHRDIKPENFIVYEDFTTAKVVVKLTDWGLGSSDDMCTDFDTGSKPYMAPECRENRHPSYDPKRADVWSLGICLINMLFHRSPWHDPTRLDPSYCEFLEAPVSFMVNRFEGMPRTTANFLVNKVFCDLEDGSERLTAEEFGQWADNLVDHFGGGKKKGSFSVATIPLISTVTRPSIALDPRLSTVFQARFGMSSITPAIPRPNFNKHGITSDSTQTDPPSNRLSSYKAEFRALRPPSPPLIPEEPPSPRVLTKSASLVSLNSDGEKKRRKRGARRSRRGDGDVSCETSPLSTTVESERNENRARTLSINTDGISSTSSAKKKVMSPAESSKTVTKKHSFWGSLVKSGNQDLQAFKASIHEKNVQLGVISAPAKMQKGAAISGESPISSFASNGTTNSWGSWNNEPDRRELSTASHWASATNRRARIDQRKREETPSPSATRYGTSSSSTTLNSSLTSRPSHTPLSSFSSIASNDAKSSISKPPDRKPASTQVYKPPIKRAPNGSDTPKHVHSKLRPLGPLNENNEVSFYQKRDAATSTTSLRSINSPKTLGRPGSASSSEKPRNKLAKLLESVRRSNNSIGVTTK